MKKVLFLKDRSAIKYYIVALICVICVYSGELMEFLKPVLDNIDYGTLTRMLINIFKGVLWLIEFVVLVLVSHKFGIDILFRKEDKGKELPLWRLIVLYIFAIVPMFIISAVLGFRVKIVYELGEKVTSFGFVQNAVNMCSWIVRIAFITTFISCLHSGFERNIKFTNEKVNKYFPYGAIMSFLVFGLIDFFFLGTNLRAFYLIATVLYGIAYLLSEKKFMTTFIVSYLIWLL